MLNESNISNNERQYRNFVNMVKAYSPKTDIANVRVVKTSKGNWKVYDGDKKICLVSHNILNDNVVDIYNLKREENV